MGVITKIHPVDVTVKKAIDYIVDDKKTEYGEYVSAINCDLMFADRQMERTRRTFNKGKGTANDKHLCFHLIQSFDNVDNLDEAVVHEIGIEFANIMFKDFEVVVATHNNTEHLHNHFIINAVSFVDGHKYNDCDKTKQMIRELSDRISKEHGIDIYEKTKRFQRNIAKERDSNTKLRIDDYRNTNQYVEWSNEHPNFRKMIAHDIDIVIKNKEVIDIESFVECMKLLDYEVKYKKVKYMSFKAPGSQRFIRGNSIGENYTREGIEKSIQEKMENKNYSRTEDVQDYKEIKSIKKESLEQLERYIQQQETSKNELSNYLLEQIKSANQIIRNAYTGKGDFEFDKESQYTYDEQKIINRINKTIRNIHNIKKYEIENMGVLEARLQSIYSKKNNIAIILEKTEGAMRKREAIEEIIRSYQEESEKINKGEVKDTNKEFVEMKNYLIKKKLMDRNAQEKYIEDNKTYRYKMEDYIEDYKKICTAYAELIELKKALNKVVKRDEISSKKLGKNEMSGKEIPERSNEDREK